MIHSHQTAIVVWAVGPSLSDSVRGKRAGSLTAWSGAAGHKAAACRGMRPESRCSQDGSPDCLPSLSEENLLTPGSQDALPLSGEEKGSPPV